MCVLIIHTKHFMMTDVGAMDRTSLRQEAAEVFGMGTKVEVLRMVGTIHWLRDRLKKLVNTT